MLGGTRDKIQHEPPMRITTSENVPETRRVKVRVSTTLCINDLR